MGAPISKSARRAGGRRSKTQKNETGETPVLRYQRQSAVISGSSLCGLCALCGKNVSARGYASTLRSGATAEDGRPTDFFAFTSAEIFAPFVPFCGKKDLKGPVLKYFRLQAGYVTYGVRDVGKRFQRQMSALRVKHRPRGGVNLHERNVRAR